MATNKQTTNHSVAPEARNGDIEIPVVNAATLVGPMSAKSIADVLLTKGVVLDLVSNATLVGPMSARSVADVLLTQGVVLDLVSKTTLGGSFTANDNVVVERYSSKGSDFVLTTKARALVTVVTNCVARIPSVFVHNIDATLPILRESTDFNVSLVYPIGIIPYVNILTSVIHVRPNKDFIHNIEIAPHVTVEGTVDHKISHTFVTNTKVDVSDNYAAIDFSHVASHTHEHTVESVLPALHVKVDVRQRRPIDDDPVYHIYLTENIVVTFNIEGAEIVVERRPY